LAQTLRTNAETIDDMARRLEVWNDDVENLLPQLDWIAQTALRQKATGPLNNRPAGDGATSILEILLTTLADGILLCDLKGNVLKANSAAARILSLPLEAMSEQNLQTIFPSDARWEQLIGSFRLALTLGDKQLPPPPPSSATFFQNSRFVKASLVSLPKNNYLGAAILVVLRDISVEMAGWITRDETVNNLSENLRTPMAAANSYSDLLLNESVGLITTAQRRYLQRICRAVDLMEAVLVDFTGQGRQVLPKTQLQKVNLSDIFNEAIEAAREELTLAGVNLDSRLDQSLPPVNIVPEYFTKITTDLLIRAGAHMQVGETMLLTTEIQEENDQPAYLVVTLHNQSPRLEPTRQLDEDPHLKSIADAVKYQGGRLWLETDYQGRWRICFLLPVAS
jgi:signal transduction histidine kinase